MSVTNEKKHKKTGCYHCGEVCVGNSIQLGEKYFCCEGCKMVYQILNESGLCEYYNLNEKPGITQKIRIRENKFAFLEDEKIQARLIQFRNDKQVHVSFYLPQIHCSSCLYLLENIHRLHEGIISAKVNFILKEVDIVFDPNNITLRKVVETLTAIGYEPYISLNDLKEKRPGIDKSLVIQLGVAGFCFANIMLLSFPEYLGIDASEVRLRWVFRWINFLLSLPVLLYAALPFYTSAFQGLKHRFLNIDTPIALAIVITFVRSAYEVMSVTGAGYFDSMTGIVFFMLTGRILQDKTYRQLSFDRDYNSYFPVAVTVVKEEGEIPASLPEVKPGHTLLIHNEELIPADGILTKGKALIDYSFVTGESLPVLKEVGELVYAGGKQTGGNIEVLVIKEVAQSYLTRLWNNEEVKTGATTKKVSFVHVLSKWFTAIVLIIAAITAIYWQLNNPAKLWPAVTAVFIIACPCALLLSNTFTNGNILRILGNNHFYLKNAQTIEAIATATHIVFDKTGTLTHTLQHDIAYEGKPLTPKERQQVAALARSSLHPLSKALVNHLGADSYLPIQAFKETAGAGIEGFVKNDLIKIGSCEFVTGEKELANGTAVYIKIEKEIVGCFCFGNCYRQHIAALLNQLKHHYRLSVLSGDNPFEAERLQQMLGADVKLLFYQKPEDKLNYIKRLQQKGENVMMIGDGLNDGVALKQSNIGIAVSEHTNNFTPSSDAIIEAGKLTWLLRFIKLCRANRVIVTISFIVSIIYNLIGLYFAVQGNLSPLIAAILMPASSLSILLLTFTSTSLVAQSMGLHGSSKRR